MHPTPLEPSFPLSIIILCYIATGLMVLILLHLVMMNSKLSVLCAKLSRPGRAANPETYEASPNGNDSPNADESKNVVEATPGTNFEEFLNEDPERGKLTKKEQFKAYRAWRTEKGLNWSK